MARLRFAVAMGSVLLGTATTAFAQSPVLAPVAPPAGSAVEPPKPWHVVGLPQQTKPFTRFSSVTVDGKRAVKVEADSSFGNLVHPLAGNVGPGKLSWQWRLEKPLDESDLRDKRGDDTALKVCAFFDEPLENVSFADRQVLRYARSKSVDPVPAATVCYVWDTHLAEGTALDSPFTRRLRYIVVESGSGKLDKWVAEKRDLAADFKKLFGDESPQIPPLIGIAVGADADNTKGKSVGYVADVVLEP